MANQKQNTVTYNLCFNGIKYLKDINSVMAFT